MRILVVEDEHKIAASIKKGLEQESYAVDTVHNGIQGYDFALVEEYDLIILDRLLPGMDGLRICKKLREQQVHTPIIMLTAKGQIEDRVEGLDTGADDYLTKPFAFSELLARIRALIRRPKQFAGTTLQVSNLLLNPSTYEVTRANNRIILSQKEYTLLEYLMRHKEKIVSKDQIINHVWDYNDDVLPNSVEVYIKHLREKIDKPYPTHPLIHTIRGFGYKIAEEK